MSSGGGRNDSKLIFLLALAMIVPVGAGVYSLMLTKTPTHVSSSGFNVLGVEQTKEPQYLRQAVASQDASSPLPLAGRLKLAPQGRPPDFAGPQTPAMGAGGRQEAPPAASRQREKEFLRRYGGQLSQYEGRLGRITSRYYRQDPVVREVDRAFGSMPRYMAIKQRYQRDGDPFQFVRESVSLPEVRTEVKRRMADPRVWRASLGMILDALKEPPPKAIYNEAKVFVTQDQAMNNYMDGFTQDVYKYMPNAVEAIPPNADMGSLWRLVSDISPNAAAVSSGTAASRR